MDTISKYEEENQNERGGWRRVVGAILAFVGFIVFANVTFIALFFRYALPLGIELALVSAGGIIGVIGLKVRGYRNELIIPAALTVFSGVVATWLVDFLSEKFNLVGLLIIGAVLAWWTNRSFSRVED